jgi:hypothetical protein
MAIQSDASQYYADFPDANLPDANDINNYASGINLLLSDSYKEVGLEEGFDFFTLSISSSRPTYSSAHLQCRGNAHSGGE